MSCLYVPGRFNQRRASALDGMGRMPDFVAIDVETANASFGSICQIGVVSFRNGVVEDVWHSLIDPEDFFASFNVRIHGITEDAVKGAPTFPKVEARIRQLTRDTVVVSHGAFDRGALRGAAERYGLGAFDCSWLDTVRVARRAWPEHAAEGYGLGAIAKRLGIAFKHHDAAEDARVAGEVLVRAVERSGISVSEWLQSVKKPASDKQSSRVSMGALSDDGPLAGEVVVFTGALSMPRHEAAKLAAQAGGEVKDSVGRKTTVLVVGDQDLRALSGHEKSSKHMKAELLASEGQAIRFLGESDFLKLLNLDA